MISYRAHVSEYHHENGNSLLLADRERDGEDAGSFDIADPQKLDQKCGVNRGRKHRRRSRVSREEIERVGLGNPTADTCLYIDFVLFELGLGLVPIMFCVVFLNCGWIQFRFVHAFH